MTRRELAARAAEILHENNIRKPVKIKKHTFVVTDDDGNSANFAVKRADKMVLYSVEDVQNAIDALIEAMREGLQRGESISIKGFGTICLRKRAPRRVQIPGTNEWLDLPGYYAPWFIFSKAFKMAAKLYELSANESEVAERVHQIEVDDAELNDGADDDAIDFDDLEW